MIDHEQVKGQIIDAMKAFDPVPPDIEAEMRKAEPLQMASMWLTMACHVFRELGGKIENLAGQEQMPMGRL